VTHDTESIVLWTRIFVGFAAFFTTCFPLLYAPSPWYETRLGRALMSQGISVAFAGDMTFIFLIWKPTNLTFIFYVNLFGFAGIALSTGYLTWMMLKHNVIIPLQLARQENSR